MSGHDYYDAPNYTQSNAIPYLTIQNASQSGQMNGSQSDTNQMYQNSQCSASFTHNPVTAVRQVRQSVSSNTYNQ